MTKEEIIAIVEAYVELLQDEHMYKVSARYRHIITMLPKMKEMDWEDIKQRDKLNRWLGFIQGVLWPEIYFLEDLKVHNKSGFVE